MKAIKTTVRCIALLITAAALSMLFGCARELELPLPTASPRGTQSAAFASESPAEKPTEAPAATPAPETSVTPKPTVTAPAEPKHTPIALERTASLGFAGDVLIMQSQVNAARKPDGGYDFKDTFRPMQGLFESVDFMVLNFEGTLAGEEAGYTQPKPTAIPATPENPNPRPLYQRLNAPDELVGDLMELGVDGFSTANNHCLDKGVEGLLRTIEVMDSYGVFHTGTFASPERFQTADIAEINGIKVGFVSTAKSLNGYDGYMDVMQSSYMVLRLTNEEMTRAAIERCREQGAELVVVMPHWGSQYQNSRNSEQIAQAQKMISWGADVIIGCHAHVVQEIEWVSAERGGETVTAPVVYCMGNFVSSMSRSEHTTDIGLFARIDIKKDASGRVSVTGASYIPTYDNVGQTRDGRYLHQVFPCFEDMKGIAGVDGGLPTSGLARAREHCAKVISGEIPYIKNPYLD